MMTEETTYPIYNCSAPPSEAPHPAQIEPQRVDAIQVSRLKMIWGAVMAFIYPPKDRQAVVLSAKVTYLEADNTRLNDIMRQFNWQRRKHFLVFLDINSLAQAQDGTSAKIKIARG